MFERFADNCIKITRGDDAKSTLTINAGTKMRPEVYELKEGDQLLFHIMEPNQKFEDAFLKKIYTKDDLDENKDVVIVFTHADTVDLVQGLYYYEVKLIEADGTYITIIPMSRFIIEN